MPPTKTTPPAPGLLLPLDASASTEPQTFAVLPGMYQPGVASPLPDGWTVEDVERTIAEAGLPLRLVKGDA